MGSHKIILGKRCEHCGAPMEARSTRKRFCSIQCIREATRAIKNERQRATRALQRARDRAAREAAKKRNAQPQRVAPVAPLEQTVRALPGGGHEIIRGRVACAPRSPFARHDAFHPAAEPPIISRDGLAKVRERVRNLKCSREGDWKCETTSFIKGKAACAGSAKPAEARGASAPGKQLAPSLTPKRTSKPPSAASDAACPKRL